MIADAIPLAARWRGVMTGALTVTLALGAHTTSGGGLPSGSGAVMLGVTAITLGALASTLACAATARGLLTLLASGQALTHLLLGTADHHHVGGAGPTSVVMVAGHVTAIFVGAALIAAAGRFGDALSRAVRATTTAARPTVCTRPTRAMHSADQPLRSALELAASLSHRGPPVGWTR